MGVIHRNSAAELVLSDQGQMFAGVATIRAAIFDVLDDDYAYYDLYQGEQNPDISLVDEHRGEFVDAVIKRISELQCPPHDGIKLENLCPRHRREALPAPTAAVCGMCLTERGK